MLLTLYGHIKTSEQRTIIRWLAHWPLMGGLLRLVQLEMHDEIFHFEIFKNFMKILKYFKTQNF